MIGRNAQAGAEAVGRGATLVGAQVYEASKDVPGTVRKGAETVKCDEPLSAHALVFDSFLPHLGTERQCGRCTQLTCTFGAQGRRRVRCCGHG